MKLYRNHYSKEGGCSGGFSFHSSQRDAIEAAKNWNPDNERPLTIAEPLKIEKSKAGILSFLNNYAGHPDNG